eukprot:TRINITY_DN2545_c1_g1_i1.p1 TRINITY_DN2545_c1_g1~~TRINITY_DN2545_c1_g1_i1.p1  ORF type:complete len:412 (+),score=40.03 TRINITY_DN2545_c1_g1_i1:62-1297(+)
MTWAHASAWTLAALLICHAARPGEKLKRILLLGGGTRGDNEPLGILKEGLKRAGWEVIGVGGHEVQWADVVVRGLTPLHHDVGDRQVRQWKNHEEASKYKQALTDEDWSRHILSGQNGLFDIVVSSVPSLPLLASYLTSHEGTPAVLLLFQPWSATPDDQPSYQESSGHHDSENSTFFKKVLEGSHPKVKVLRCYPREFAVGDDVRECVGCVRRSWEVGGKLPEVVEKFLEKSEKVVYMGFGSMTVEAWQRKVTLAKFIEAVKELGALGVVDSGWAKFSPSDIVKSSDKKFAESNVLFLPPTPHDLLFPRLSAAIHHGGAGTTTTAITHKVPSIITPLHFDQPHFASIVQQLGVGIASPPLWDPETGLARKLKMVMGSEYRVRCKEVAESIAGQRGVDAVVGAVGVGLMRG